MGRRRRSAIGSIIRMIILAFVIAIAWQVYEDWHDSRSGEIVQMSTIRYSYEQMEKDISTLRRAYPKLISVEVPAVSSDGRGLYLLHVGNMQAENHVLIQASMHAREYVNTQICMKQIEMLCRDAGTAGSHGWTGAALLDKVCFHIFPMDNPDGVAICQEGPGAIRNSSLRAIIDDCYSRESNGDPGYWKKWKANARGVDLNTNFDARWDTYTSGSSYPSSKKYKGETPASEPEVQIILKTAEKYKVCFVLSYHMAGGVVYWNYASGSALETEEELCRLLTSLTGYYADTISTPCGCSNYFGEVKNIPSITLEMVAGHGGEDYPLGEEVLAPAWDAAAEILPELAFYFSNLPEK